ncbi:MAG: glycoside hydrolase family 3 N-terminal domain-containing protein [Anaerolineales bacterium]|nr:glycoside hydrolase family 3 N-terminal domain-containing protein [Anaerolineales bacterium]
MNARRLFSVLLLLSLLQPLGAARAAPPSQETIYTEKARALLEGLTPEERVGQLFLVTYKGNQVGEGTQIYDLVVNYHIGGVTLLAGNDNFITGENALNHVLAMTREMQLNRWASAQLEMTNTVTGQAYQPKFIPLFVSISQEGDGYPNDQILNGLTPLPNEMTLGATWNPSLAYETGVVLGSELTALGFNLLFGPALDVLETPQTGGPVDLGTRTFGGDPYWVGVMGSAFTNGIHEGSNNKIAVIAKHFPGNGGSDRSPDEEVATVRKSLERLKNFDLMPFFAVTGGASSQGTTVDGLLASHIRYQGFQENIRSTTRPVSFDPQAFSQLMSLPALSTWRQNGGIMICDNLGSRAVRRFYELARQPFDARRVALNAFLAGNDIIYLGDITSSDDPDSYTSTIKILAYFAQKYRDDPAFAQQVDASVLRILALKYRLYDNFDLQSVLAPPDGVTRVGDSAQVTFEVARQAATLISPSLAELNDDLPDPPRFSDRIVFFSDVRSAQQCSQCPLQPILSVDSFQQAVLRLYGPQAGSQIYPPYLTSYSFEQLLQMLDGVEESQAIERTIRGAQWLVFAMLNVSADLPSSSALARFLAERPDLFQQKRLIVFSFNAPYYMDSTNIAKVSAYFGLYSKNPIFIEVASRLLFREIVPSGYLPVSVPAVGYDLITATSPDPEQVIPLSLDVSLPETAITPTVESLVGTPEYHIGSTIPVRTGIILDHNSHPVPDGTPVQFIVTVNGEVTTLPLAGTTTDGIAHTTININAAGTWEIRAESEPAKQSDILQFEIPPEGGPILTPPITPEPSPTPTPEPSPTVAPSGEVEEQKPPHTPGPVDWLVTLLLSSLIGYSSYRLAALNGQVRWGLRGALLAIIGGFVAYLYIVLKMPGSQALLLDLGIWAVVLLAGLGAILGMISVWGWRSISADMKGK